ncbi:hypothetical protein M407DRAFT_245842 [Tulasnella calospora MUT 4182]|uniref:Uncharacterized protein n=1 Tax=Tulasnella calospora MUT 4182 TaxID=1051891 RepID=A0A0C3Q831_9AGAM|nr:hypothetical protein M407DRAFT_245842 [Tulasnella calospora MUT 4182]
MSLVTPSTFIPPTVARPGELVVVHTCLIGQQSLFIDGLPLGSASTNLMAIWTMITRYYSIPHFYPPLIASALDVSGPIRAADAWRRSTEDSSARWNANSSTSFYRRLALRSLSGL